MKSHLGPPGEPSPSKATAVIAVGSSANRQPLPSLAELQARREAVGAWQGVDDGRIEKRCTDALPHHASLAARVTAPGRPKKERLAVAIRLVDELGSTLQPFLACRKGCDHCCHIPVQMTQLEAERLGRAIGREPNARLRYRPSAPEAFGYHTPCPFLKDGMCSVYEHRPFACRHQHSLDSDALFCRLDVPDGYAASVPRVQYNVALLVYGSAMSSSMKVGDIRDWFPGTPELEQGPIGVLQTLGEAVETAEVAARSVNRPSVLSKLGSEAHRHGSAGGAMPFDPQHSKPG